MKIVGLFFLSIFGLILLLAPLFLIWTIDAGPVMVPATETWMEDGIQHVSRPAPDAAPSILGMDPGLAAVLFLLTCWGVLALFSFRAVFPARSLGADSEGGARFILKFGERGELNQDETRMFQEIYRGLGAMEKRVESLETILIDRTIDRPVPFD